MNSAVLLAGSNVGDRRVNLFTAQQLAEESGCRILRSSGIYETAPWGNTQQDPFLNQAWLAQTPLEAPELMEALLTVERKMGRQRTTQWAPRLIDIDLLFFNHLILRSGTLEVPHPRLHLRRFALAPMAEIVPDWVHPVLHKTVAALLAETEDLLEVALYKP